MLFQQNLNSNETSSFDQDKYQLALDAVIKQMNLLSNDPFNENLRLAHEQARQRFTQLSNMEKDAYEKFIHSKASQNQTINSPQDRIQHVEQSWPYILQKLFIGYFILILLFLILTITCIIIAIK